MDTKPVMHQVTEVTFQCGQNTAKVFLAIKENSNIESPYSLFNKDVFLSKMNIRSIQRDSFRGILKDLIYK
jgi:hypothetical protein